MKRPLQPELFPLPWFAETEEEFRSSFPHPISAAVVKRWVAMRSHQPRIELEVWPQGPSMGTWFRYVGTEPGPWQYTAARHGKTTSEASRALGEAHGHIPVFTTYGVRLYSPDPLPRRRPAYELDVWREASRDAPAGWYFMFRTRSMRRALDAKRAYTERHGLVARVFVARGRHREGPLDESERGVFP